MSTTETGSGGDSGRTKHRSPEIKSPPRTMVLAAIATLKAERTRQHENQTTVRVSPVLEGHVLLSIAEKLKNPNAEGDTEFRDLVDVAILHLERMQSPLREHKTLLAGLKELKATFETDEVE